MKIWQWTPNWQGPVLERLEWLTDVLSSKNLTEQAIRLRNVPRRSFEFEVVVHERQRRTLEAALFGRQAEEWLLPVWPDGAFLDAGVALGATGIAVDAMYRDYRAGGQAVLIGGHIAEAVTIDTVLADHITLVTGTVNAYARGVRLYPARPARMQASQPLQRLSDELATLTCRLQLTDNSEHALPTPATYRGLPVLEQPPNWRDDLAADYQRQIATLDYGVGRRYVEDIAGRGEVLQGHRWTLQGRASIDGFRAWLYALAGRQGAFWLPTWCQDLRVLGDIAHDALTIDVEHCGFVDHLALALNRRDIEIRIRSGSVFRRRIVAAAAVDANTERLTLNAHLGVDVAAGDIVRVSFLQTARLEADAVEIAWHTGALAESAQQLRVVNHDV